MGFFSRFERRVEDGFDNINDKLFDSPISPVQIAKKAEKQMRREKMVGAGKEFAPTLYTVLVNPDDDDRLFGYYPTLAGETETYLKAKASEEGLVMDGEPLVRFIVDDELKSGRFDIIAEMVSAPIIAQLRAEEMARYGLAPQAPAYGARGANPYASSTPQGGVSVIGGAPAGGVGASAMGGAAGAGSFAMAGTNRSRGAEHIVSNMRATRDGGAQDAQNIDPLSGIDVMAEEVVVDEFAPEQGQSAIPNTQLFPEEVPGAPHVAPATNAGPAPHLVNLVTGRSFVLAKPSIVLGRGLSCDIVLDDLNASRTHAQMQEIAPATWQISDLGSLNGTLVNGKHIAEFIVSEGDRISIGATTFLFTYN